MLEASLAQSRTTCCIVGGGPAGVMTGYLLARSGVRVIGVEAKTPSGSVQISADLVIGCDGRHSVIRHAARMQAIELGVPVDVLWFRISRKSDDPETSLGNINHGKALVLINRSNYFQAGLIIAKGSFDQIRQNGLAAFQRQLAEIAPWLGDRVAELKDWDQIKLLSIQINRLKQWHQPGLLCIGDAAHAMSPAGGVGINLAVQDAVATVNLLAHPLREGRVTEELLSRVQKRREFPTRVTQQIQLAAHKRMISIFRDPGPAKPSWKLKLAANLPGLPRLLGRLVGIGLRPEHIQSGPSSSDE